MTERLDDEIELEVIRDVIDRISTNVSMLVDREIKIRDVTTTHATERPAGRSSVHISFKLGFSNDSGAEGQGCLLVPLPDALSLACYLMMFPEGEVKAQRKNKELDQSTKDAMLELGNFIGAAVDEVLRSHPYYTSVRMDGCQGVRSNVRPALNYSDGEELLVGRALVQLHEFPEFEMIMIVPPLPLGSLT
jgi:hypothetical protein